jgi:hypothetical protein
MSPEQLRAERNLIVARRYRKRRQLAALRGIDAGPIAAADVRNHAKKLLDLGWSAKAMIDWTGIGTTTGLLLIINGNTVKAERKWEAILRIPLTYAVPEHLPETTLVPAEGAVRRVRALMALGWRHEDLTPLIGRTSSHLVSARYPRINALDWRIIDAAYEKLSGTPGPSAGTRTRAAAQGFLPPLAWDDIDAPGRPNWRIKHADLTFDRVTVQRIISGDWRMPSTRADRLEVLRVWTGSIGELERLTGWNVNRLRRQAEAMGQPVEEESA